MMYKSACLFRYLFNDQIRRYIKVLADREESADIEKLADRKEVTDIRDPL